MTEEFLETDDVICPYCNEDTHLLSELPADIIECEHLIYVRTNEGGFEYIMKIMIQNIH